MTRPLVPCANPPACGVRIGHEPGTVCRSRAQGRLGAAQLAVPAVRSSSPLGFTADAVKKRPVLSTDQVRELARQLHAGQVDKSGNDYFAAHLEPIAQELAPLGPILQQAGYLHDSIEDIEHVDALYLLAQGVDARVVHIVMMVSRQRDPLTGKPETYKQLIARSSSEFGSATVKLTDNSRNIAANPELALQDPAMAHSMLTKRYLPARAQLLEQLHQQALAEYAARQQPT